MWILKGSAHKAFAVLFVIALSIFSWVSVKEHTARSHDSDESLFSAERAFTHVKNLALSPRTLGSTSHKVTRRYLIDELEKLGCETQTQKAIAFTRPPYKQSSGAIENIFCMILGEKPTGTLMLMSHYDTVHNSPGASDSAAGVAAILEVLRAILSQEKTFQNNIAVLFTDGEELGLLGASEFVRNEYPLQINLKMLINFEARGNSGPAALFETINFSKNLASSFERLESPLGNSMMNLIYEFLPNETDLSAFKGLAIQGLNFAFAKGLQHYHTSNDTAENLSLGSLQQEGDAALSVSQHALNASFTENATITETKDKRSSYLYTDILGKYFWVYPKMLVYILNAALLFLIIFYLWSWEFSIAKTLLGFLISSLFILIFAFLEHTTITFLTNSYGQNFIAQNVYLIFSLSLLMYFSIFHTLWLKIRIYLKEICAAHLIFYSLLLIMGFYYPESSVVFTWPLAGIILFLVRPSYLTMFLGALPAAIFVPSFIHFLLIADSGINMWAPLLVFAFFISILQLLLWNPWEFGKVYDHKSVEVIQVSSYPLTHLFFCAIGIVSAVLFLKPEMESSLIKNSPNTYFEVYYQNKLYIGLNPKTPIIDTALFGSESSEAKQNEILNMLWKWTYNDPNIKIYEANNAMQLNETRFVYTFAAKSNEEASSKTYILEVPQQNADCAVFFINNSPHIKDIRVNDKKPFEIPPKRIMASQNIYFYEHCGLKNAGMTLSFKYNNQNSTQRDEFYMVFTQNTRPAREFLAPFDEKKRTFMTPLSNSLYSIKKVEI